MLEQICLYWGTGEDAVGNADCYRKKENIHLIQILAGGVRGDEVWNISITLEVAKNRPKRDVSTQKSQLRSRF